MKVQVKISLDDDVLFKINGHRKLVSLSDYINDVLKKRMKNIETQRVSQKEAWAYRKKNENRRYL